MMLPIGFLTPAINFFGKYGLIIGLLGVFALGLYGKGRVDGSMAVSDKFNKQIGEMNVALQVEQKNRKSIQDALDKQNAELAKARVDSENKKADIEAAKKEAQLAIRAFGEKAKALEVIIKDRSKKTPEQQCSDAAKALDDYVKDGAKK